MVCRQQVAPSGAENIYNIILPRSFDYAYGFAQDDKIVHLAEFSYIDLNPDKGAFGKTVTILVLSAKRKLRRKNLRFSYGGKKTGNLQRSMIL